jgi:YVTN family beta-propeller protein
MRFIIEILFTILLGSLLLPQAVFGLEVEKISFPVDFAPDRNNTLVFTSDNRVGFAASSRTDTLFAFDASTGSMLGSISTGDGPASIALCECGGRRVVAVVNAAFIGSPVPSVTFIDASEPSRLSLISTAGIEKKFGLNSATRTLAFNADGSTAFISAISQKGRAAIFSLEVSTGNLLDRLDLDILPVSSANISKAGSERLVLIGNVGQQSEVLLIDISDKQSLRVATRLNLPTGTGFSNDNNIVVSGDGNFAYFTSIDSNSLYEIDLEKGRVAAQVEAGNFPTQVDLIEDGQSRKVAVTAIFDGSVNIFDASRPAEIKKTATFRSQSQILTTTPVLSADGSKGFVATEFGNRLYTFDALTGEQLGMLQLEGPPVNLKLSRKVSTERLGFIDMRNNQVLLFDTSLGKLNQTGNFAPRDGVSFTLTQNILLSKNGSLAFVASPTSNELLIIDTTKRMVKQRVKVGERPERIALVELESLARVAVVNINSSSVSLVEVSDGGASVTGTLKLSNTDPTELSLTVVAFSGDGKFGFVSDGTSRLIKFDAKSGQLLDSLQVGRDPLGLALFEKNGVRRIAVFCIPPDLPAEVVIVDATDPLLEKARFRATPEQKFALNNLPVFSADGKNLFIVSSFSLELMSINADTGRLVSILKGVNAVQPTGFTRQGREMLILVNIGTSRFPIVEVDSRGRFQVKARLRRPKEDLFIVGNNAAVDQTANRAYVTNYVSGDLILFNPESGAVIKAMALGNGPCALALSADGRRLVVLEANGGTNQINILNLEEHED